MSISEYVASLVVACGPLTAEQVESAARILAGSDEMDVAA